MVAQLVLVRVSVLSGVADCDRNNDHLGSNAGLFIPTIYTDTPYYEDAKLQSGTKYLMGWNEPDIDIQGVAVKINAASQSAVERYVRV